MTTAFHGMLRVGEMTGATNIKLEDIQFEEDSVRVKIWD